MADLLEVLQFWSEPEDRDGKLTVWSCCKLDGKFFPGVDSLDDEGACIAIPRTVRELNLDKLKSKGRNVTRLIHEGYKAAEIEIEVRIWKIEQWRKWLSYLPKIDPARKITKTQTVQKVVKVSASAPIESVIQSAPTGDVTVATAEAAGPFIETKRETVTTQEIPAHTIEHPDLEPFGISSIFITSISTPGDVEDGGVRTIRIRATEIVKPTTGNKAVAKSVASAGERLNRDADVLPEFKLDTGPRS